MWAVADDLAIGAEHGLLQANRVHIRFVRPVSHDTPPLVVQSIAHRTAGYLNCLMKSLHVRLQSSAYKCVSASDRSFAVPETAAVALRRYFTTGSAQP